MKKKFITVGDMRVEVWWKAVKRLNLVVYAEDGRVRISVPFFTTIRQVTNIVLTRMPWILAQQEKFRAQKPAPELRYITGERHLFMGSHYPLHVVEGHRHHSVSFDPHLGISLHLRSKSSMQQRQKLLYKWYREQLQQLIPPLLAKWQPQISPVSEWRIKRMKTRWGTCNISAHRIWINLELAKRPWQCLEYILVHEMIHLLEPGHTAKFYAHQDRLLADWRVSDRLLKEGN